jgi:hypothetical protein
VKSVALIVALTLGLGGAFVWRYSRDADQRRGQEVQARLDRAIKAGAKVRAESLTDFSFDRLVVAYGTETADKIDKQLGFEWRRSKDLGYECCEPGSLWIFVKGDEVVAYLRPDPWEVSNNGCVTAGRSYQPTSVLRLRGCS